jgi:hypothetical protein
LGENRNNLILNKLEAIAKIQAYYMTNIQSELNYVGKDLTEGKLRESVNITSVNSFIDLENEVMNISRNNSNSDLTSSSESFSNIELTIGKIFDLTVNINEEKGSDNILTSQQPPNPADLIYDPNDILDRFLEDERRIVENNDS